MPKPSAIRLSAGALLLALLSANCSFGPPPSCGEDIGGTADAATFDRFFNSISLVNQTTGQPGPDSDQGMQFTQGDPLALQVDAKADVTLRACVQPTGGQKEISFDETQTLSQGQGTLDIGAFDPGTYVIRVIVDTTLVKNFPFQVK